MTYVDTDNETYYKNEEYNDFNDYEHDLDFEIDYEYFDTHDCCYPWESK